MHPSAVREQADAVRIFAVNNILKFRVNRVLISLIYRFIHSLRVSEAVHEKDDVHFLNLLLFVHCLLGVLNHGSSFPAVFLLDLIQILHNDRRHGVIISQNILISGNARERLLVFLHQSVNLQADQLIKAHLQNRGCLALGEAELLRRLLTLL